MMRSVLLVLSSVLVPSAGFAAPPVIKIPKPEYVVVGAGAGGATVAAMLAKAGKKVVLLEEGPDSDYEGINLATGQLSDPTMTATALNQFLIPEITRNMWSETTWEYPRSTPPLTAPFTFESPIGAIHRWFLGVVNQLPEDYPLRQFEHTAKIVGGNTMHNYQIYIRPGDDSWNALGDLWDPAVLNTKFDDLEENYLKLREGYTFNATLDRHLPIRNALVAAGHTPVTLGRDVARQGPNPVGYVADTEYTRDPRDPALRISSAEAFLTPELRSMDNFELRVYSKATKVVVEDGRAVAVEYVDATGRKVTQTAKAEVILALGTLATPQLLLLSGIGPADHLAEHGIELVHELKGVGENLVNHLLVPYFLESTLPAEVTCLPLCTSTVLGYLHSSLAGYEPDVQFISLFLSDMLAEGKTVHQMYISRQALVASKGSVRLASADPNDFPILDPKYLSAESDVTAVVEGIEHMREKLLPYLSSEWSELFPGAAANLTEYVKQKATSYWHWTGTSKIGPSADAYAVVDQRLKVHGLEGLRVVDASVLGEIPNVNTQSASYMVGFHGADLILEDA